MTDSSNQADEVGGSVLAPVLRVLNELVAGGFLTEYAIGGGVGVLYYVEPVLTYDFDVVCHFPGEGPLDRPFAVVWGTEAQRVCLRRGRPGSDFGRAGSVHTR